MEQKQTNRAKKSNSSKANVKEQAHIAALLDLQDFLSEELVEEGTAYRRAFVPLTEGLGLESPRDLAPKIQPQEITPNIAKSEQVEPKEPNELPTVLPVQELPSKPFKIEVKSLRNSSSHNRAENRSNENRLAEVIESPNQSPKDDFFGSKAASPEFELESHSQSQPPPLPRPSMFKRLLAGIIDQVFVLFIWTGMIVFTSNLSNNFSTGFSIEIITDFTRPNFQRVAILEFAAAWLGYLGFSLLIFKRTFGMWVWSLGVSYGDKLEENYTLRKAMRIFWTFVFSAPIIPSILLLISQNGRNILDILSGTNVYDAD